MINLHCTAHPQYTGYHKPAKKRGGEPCSLCVLLFTINETAHQEKLFEGGKLGEGDYYLSEDGLEVTMPPEYSYYDEPMSGNGNISLMSVIALGKKAEKIKTSLTMDLLQDLSRVMDKRYPIRTSDLKAEFRAKKIGEVMEWFGIFQIPDGWEELPQDHPLWRHLAESIGDMHRDPACPFSMIIKVREDDEFPDPTL